MTFLVSCLHRNCEKVINHQPLQNFCASDNAVCSQILALTKQAMTFQKSLVSICRKLDSKVVSLEKTFETTIDNLLVGTQAVLGFIHPILITNLLSACLRHL